MLVQLCPVPDSVSGMILFCDLLFFCLYMTVFLSSTASCSFAERTFTLPALAESSYLSCHVIIIFHCVSHSFVLAVSRITCECVDGRRLDIVGVGKR